MAHEAASGVVLPALIDALPDAVVVADADGRILYANPAVTSLLGHRADTLHGESLTVLMPTRLRTAHGAGFARFLATGSGELIGSTTQVPALHAGGWEVPIDLTLSPLDPGAEGAIAGGVVVGVLRDASTTVLLERQLEVSRYLAATLRVTSALTEAPDADVAFERLLPTLCAELDWDAATLWQPEGPAGRLTYAGTWSAPGEALPHMHAVTLGRTFARGEGMPGLVWQRRGPVVVEDLWSDHRFLRGEAARLDGLRTAVAFPVLRGDTLLGVCELFSRKHRPVRPELLDVLGNAGRQIGQFLGRLRAESDVRELADTLQRSLLPSSLPVIPGVEVAARYRAGAADALVGGDTYDVMPLPDGRWMVLIADVCGTGAEAAAVTALARHTARAAAATGGPAAVLAAVNDALLREAVGPLRFVTACCLVLEPHDDGLTAQVAVAGHPRPLLRGADGTCTEVGITGRPLGIDAGICYPETVVEMAGHDALVLYTDGVTEARDDGGVQFGEDGLRALLARDGGHTATATVTAVHQAVEEHLRGSGFKVDDLAVLAIRC